MEAVRVGLRHHLEALGYRVGSDTHGLTDMIFIWGTGDRAAALFEFMPSAAQACDRMYQGSWGEEMPARFAVLPESESTSPELDLLRQIRVVPLFYGEIDGRVEFRDLSEVLRQHLAAGGSEGGKTRL